MKDNFQYREWPPPTQLASFIDCAWSLQASSCGQNPDIVYPDGHCEMIVHLGKPMLELDTNGSWQPQPAQLFATQQRTALTLKPQLPLDCIGLRLAPAASNVFLGGKLALMKDQVLNLRSVDVDWAGRFTKAARRMRQSEAPEPLWEAIAGYFQTYEPDPRAERLVQAIRQVNGLVKLKELAAREDLSVRTIHTVFAKSVGLSVKEYARIVRLKATLHALDHGISNIAHLAADHGFSDQAHATREIGRVLGLTPARLKLALAENRSEQRTLRMAAAFVRGSS